MATLSPKLDRQLGDLAQTLDTFERRELLRAVGLITSVETSDQSLIAGWEDARVPDSARAVIHQYASRPVLAAAVAAATFGLTSPEVSQLPRFRRDLLDTVLWLMTVHPLGKSATRFRSVGSDLVKDKRELRHEHVYTKKSIIDDLIASDTSEVESILREKAIGCMVTIDEHRALTKYDRTLSGWARYEAAGVRVRDTFTSSEFSTTL